MPGPLPYGRGSVRELLFFWELLSRARKQAVCVADFTDPDARGSETRPRVCSRLPNVIPEVITGGNRDFFYTPGAGIKDIRHPDAKMVRTERWKFNHYVGHGGELYDLAQDPGETRNLFADPARQNTVREMKDRLLEWLITADETDQIAPRWLL